MEEGKDLFLMVDAPLGRMSHLVCPALSLGLSFLSSLLMECPTVKKAKVYTVVSEKSD